MGVRERKSMLTHGGAERWWRVKERGGSLKTVDSKRGQWKRRKGKEDEKEKEGL